MQKEPLILFSQIPAKQGSIGLITLNRLEALNALNGTMIMALSAQLHLWADDPAISLVIIQSSSPKAFSAGGDLKEVYTYGKNRDKQGLVFYATEYKLDQLIHNYPKPYIALLSGVAMGGGLGISLHGTRVIATEYLRLAMPETGIGFFPDVGAGFFFQRCPHKIGMYLALTGSIIGVADAIFANLVHAHIPYAHLTKLIENLVTRDLATDPLGEFDSAVEKFKENPGEPALQQYAAIIEEYFSKDSVVAIIAALNKVDYAWTEQQVKILNAKSPTSLKVTFKEINMAKNMGLTECLALEYKLATKIFQQHDVYEGIRAALIDKTHDPQWQPATLQDVKDAAIEEMFAE